MFLPFLVLSLIFSLLLLFFCPPRNLKFHDPILRRHCTQTGLCAGHIDQTFPANLAPNQRVPPTANQPTNSSRNASPRISLKCLSTFTRRLVAPNLSAISTTITKSVWWIIRSQLQLAVPLAVAPRIVYHQLQTQLPIPPRGETAMCHLRNTRNRRS